MCQHSGTNLHRVIYELCERVTLAFANRSKTPLTPFSPPLKTAGQQILHHNKHLTLPSVHQQPSAYLSLLKHNSKMEETHRNNQIIVFYFLVLRIHIRNLKSRETTNNKNSPTQKMTNCTTQCVHVCFSCRT